MNPVLALAVACAATNSPLMRDLERMQPRPVKPQTKADLERIEAAQMKRKRKANKRRNDQMDWKELDRLNKALFGGDL